MKRINLCHFMLLMLVFMSGCVSSGKYKACLSDVENLKGSKAKLEDEISLKNQEISDLKNKINRLENDITSLEEEKKILEGKISALEKKNVELVSENSNLNKTLRASKDELTKTINDLRDKIKTMEEQKAELGKNLQEKENQLTLLKKELASKDAEISELRTEVRTLSTDRAKALEEKEKAIAELKKTHDKLINELKEEIKRGEIEVTQLRDKLTLQMVEKILFDSGSADIKISGKKILDRVAEILKKVTDRQIRIEGHTDNVPIGPKIAKKFPTNWELSTARATNVVRYLIEKGGIDPKFLSASGYAEYKPIDTNDTEEGRARNRRIEIVLIPLELETTKFPIEKKE